MFSKLPPLLSLRAFESAARLGSFKRAAEELAVTPAAIGAQVKALEERLGFLLFERQHRKIVATPAAFHLQQACHQAFTTLSGAIETIIPQAAERTLTIGVGSLFASRWLSPRLSRFWLVHPDIALRLTHTPDMARVENNELDAVIAWGYGDWKSYDSVELIRPHLVPVASPRYLDLHGRPQNAQTLHQHVLVHEIDHRMWRQWFGVNRTEFVNQSASTTVRDGVIALQLALDGQAIALAVEEFLEGEFSSGALEKLFESSSSKDAAYYFATPTAKAGSEPLQLFSDWLLKETSAPTTNRLLVDSD